MSIRSLSLVFALFATATPAAAKTLCTLIADAATGRVVVEQGDCRTRVTPASTFKIPLSVMGYDHGFLADAHTPQLEIRAGEPDWGGDAWRQPTDPVYWLKHSVVWYSQRITRELGLDTLTAYGRTLGYGNADFSGDPGKDNGLERSWISSSLKISPQEQVAFLSRLVNRKLPVKASAIDMTLSIVEAAPESAGWNIRGKTGSAYPRRADGSLDRSRGWGWYVGWANRGDRTLVFARLAQDEKRQSTSGGIRARDALLKEWGKLIAAAQ